MLETGSQSDMIWNIIKSTRIKVKKYDEYIFPRICGKNVVKSRKSSAKENVTPCTARERIPSL